MKTHYKAIPHLDFWLLIDADSANSKQGDTNYDLSIHSVIEKDEFAHSDTFKIIGQSKGKHRGFLLFDAPAEWDAKKEYLVELATERVFVEKELADGQQFLDKVPALKFTADEKLIINSFATL